MRPDAPNRRNHTEENVLASLGYPSARQKNRELSPVFRVFLAMAAVVVVAAVLWQLAVSAGLLPAGLLSSLSSSRGQSAANAEPQQPPILRPSPAETSAGTNAPASPGPAAPAAPSAAEPAGSPTAASATPGYAPGVLISVTIGRPNRSASFILESALR